MNTTLTKSRVDTVLRGLCALLFVGLLNSTALAEQTTYASDGDTRIQYFDYDADEVYRIPLVPEVGTLILFDSNEVITDVATDDSKDLEFTPTSAKDGAFIVYDRPLETTMTILTNLRRYTFVFDARYSNAAASQIRFQYASSRKGLVHVVPDSGKRELSVADKAGFGQRVDHTQNRYEVNTDYNFKGDRRLVPALVFDNGLYTFFEFKGEVPAIYEVLPDRREKVINRHRDGKFVVVHKVSKQLTLRLGDRSICLFNMAAYDEGKRAKGESVE